LVKAQVGRLELTQLERQLVAAEVLAARQAVTGQMATQVLVLEEHTAALVVILVTAHRKVAWVLCASSGPVLLAHSHQQIQGTCNGTLYSH
jgi:hypothetical protein